MDVVDDVAANDPVTSKVIGLSVVFPAGGIDAYVVVVGDNVVQMA